MSQRRYLLRATGDSPRHGIKTDDVFLVIDGKVAAILRDGKHIAPLIPYKRKTRTTADRGTRFVLEVRP